METEPWALDVKASSAANPGALTKLVTGVILGCGGWVLSRGADDSGTVSLLFEFERRLCIEIYSALVGSGIELSQGGHRAFTELCRCTSFHFADCEEEIASVDLEIQTLPPETVGSSLNTQRG